MTGNCATKTSRPGKDSVVGEKNRPPSLTLVTAPVTSVIHAFCSIIANKFVKLRRISLDRGFAFLPLTFSAQAPNITARYTDIVRLYDALNIANKVTSIPYSLMVCPLLMNINLYHKPTVLRHPFVRSDRMIYEDHDAIEAR